MKIIRFQRNGVTGFAQLRERAAFHLDNDAFNFVFTNETIENYELLSPIEPRPLIGIGIVVTR
ncbi:MAG: DUF2437 domain-containing protein [Armatimonadetes bacterium]|nr:DUF2437 domain-containing protein [Armatimonadota bacterium]